MSALPPADAARLVKFLGMLGSDHDGECASAGRMAHKLLTEHGLTWADVVVARSALVVLPTDRVRPAPWSSENETDHQRTARVLLQTGYAWGEWELGFLRSACNRNRPSARERIKLEELRQRFWTRRRAA